MEGGGFAVAHHFLDIRYDPSVACTVGCTWPMYSLCMAHIWPMYDLHMAHVAFRSAISSARRTDHQGTLAEKKGDLTADNDCNMNTMQAGDADQEENQYFGHNIGPRPPFDTPLIPRDANFRGESFYDGFEAIRGKCRA